jgi:hypothetical protein
MTSSVSDDPLHSALSHIRLGGHSVKYFTISAHTVEYPSSPMDSCNKSTRSLFGQPHPWLTASVHFLPSRTHQNWIGGKVI